MTPVPRIYTAGLTMPLKRGNDAAEEPEMTETKDDGATE